MNEDILVSGEVNENNVSLLSESVSVSDNSVQDNNEPVVPDTGNSGDISDSNTDNLTPDIEDIVNPDDLVPDMVPDVTIPDVPEVVVPDVVVDNVEVVLPEDAIKEIVEKTLEENALAAELEEIEEVEEIEETEESYVIMAFDDELGGYPVMAMSEVAEDYSISTLALPSGTSGYQVSDYWLNYFRGVLQKEYFSDYVAFATREPYSSGYNNYISHYWLYVGDIENGGEVTIYDCYSENSINHVDITTGTIDAINVDSYDTLIYSNLGNVSDIREGGGFVGTATILFFFGFFAVYTVCHNFFSNVFYKWSRCSSK